MNNNCAKESSPRFNIDPEWSLILVFYLLSSLFFINYYIHQIDADGISYISLAQKYLRGDISEAINGHWAPLISWLLVPFLYMGIEPIVAFRIASIVIGMLTLVGINKLMAELQLSKYVRVLYLFSLSPLIAWSAQNDVGADLLCACLLIFYLSAVFRDEYQSNKFLGFRAGLLGALSYAAKNYNFYFFILHFSCINLIYWTKAINKKQKSVIAVNFSSAIVIFILLAGTWIAIISHKYDKFTVGTAGRYNLSFIRPGVSDHPMLTEGLMAPPNETAISAWEDPTFMRLQSWNPFKSFEDFRHYLSRIYKNITKYLLGIAKNYIFDLTIIYFIIGLIFFKKRFETKVYHIIFTILLYPLGYFALYYDGQRYVWLNNFLFYVLNAYILNSIFLKFKSRKLIKLSVSAALSLSLTALSLALFIFDKSERAALNSAYSVSNEIKENYSMENKNIASQGGDWNYTFDLSYFLKARYYGRAKANITDEQLRNALIADNIQYFLVYGKLNNNIDILKPGKHFDALIGNFTIYKIVRTK